MSEPHRRGKSRSFCSERCFAHYRRAAFKKNKVCDWCNSKKEENGDNSDEFVSIIDKDTQLQFCK